MAAGDAEKALALECGPAALAQIFCVSKTTIANWLADGMPKLARGRFNLGDVVRWRRDRDREATAARGGPLADERRRLIAEQTRGLEIDNRQRAAELLEREDVAADARAYLDILDGVLDKLPDVAADLAQAAGDPVTVQRLLRDRCRQARVQMAAALDAHAAALAGEAKRGNGAGG